MAPNWHLVITLIYYTNIPLLNEYKERNVLIIRIIRVYNILTHNDIRNISVKSKEMKMAIIDK